MSPELTGIAQKTEAVILQRLASLGQVTVAQRLGISESKVSRFKDKQAGHDESFIVECCNFLAALDLKGTPKGYKCYKPDILQAMLTLAKAQMEQTSSIESLQFED